MKCTVCGTEIADEKTICPNCGSPVAEKAEEVTPVSEEAAPMEEAAETISETPSQASAAPVTLTKPVVEEETAEEPTQEAPAEEAAPETPEESADALEETKSEILGTEDAPTSAQESAEAAAQQPEKKRNVGKIVLLCCIPVAIVLIVLGVIFGVGFSQNKKCTESLDAYWTAYETGDGDAYADLVSDSFWSYISDTYELNQEEALASLDLYLADAADALGGDLSVEWDQASSSFGIGSSGLDEAKEATDAYNITISSAIGGSVTAEVTGAEDSTTIEEDIWVVKVDGKWCNTAAMADIDAACDTYAAMAKYAVEYGDLMNTYWTAITTMDAESMATLVPDGLWTLLEEQYGVTQEEAETYLNDYLTQILEANYTDISSLSTSCTVTDAQEYEESDLESLNEGLDTYGLAGDSAVDVVMNLAIYADGDSTEDSTYVTVTTIDGTPYIYDAMYYFAQACYVNATSGTDDTAE